MEFEKVREIIEQAVEVVLSRDGDVTTEDGNFATVDEDSIIRLELAITSAFSLDSDNLDHSECWKINTILDNMRE